MDVAAADVNGDGKDELFVYAGRWKDENGTRYAYVDVFDTASMERTGQLKINAGKASAYQQATQWQWQIEKIPVVTLAGGDLDRDGKEEIAVTSSAPTDNNNVASAAHLTVFTEESGTLTPVSGLNTVSLADGEQAMVSANCAFGTFSLPDTGITGTVLIAAGYQSNNASSAHDSGAYTTAAYRFAYYDPQSKKFKLSEYRTQALGDSGKKIVQSYIDDPDEDYYRPSMRLSRSAARIWRASVQTTATMRYCSAEKSTILTLPAVSRPSFRPSAYAPRRSTSTARTRPRNRSGSAMCRRA